MKSNVIWALVTGLAVGFLVGREFSHSSAGGGGDSGTPAVAAKGAPTVTGPIPADWLKEGDFGATDQFVGLSPAQRFAVLKVLNEKPCDCGCPHGSVAKCKKEDPNCPRAPTIITQAIAAAKQGKNVEEILAAVKKPGGDSPAAPSAPAPAKAQKVELAAWTPVKGPKDAKVTIIEWSDFQCPFCSRVVPTVKEIEQKYPKDVRIAFRNQPLPFHNHAREAAEAAMAANAQGKFWEMHDKLFANQQKLDRADLDGYAKEIGLNMGKYAEAMDKHLYKDQIDKDSAAGTAAGASGTPSLFVNGQSLVGAQPFDTFKPVIEAEIKHADALLAKGTPRAKLYQEILNTLPSAPTPAAAPSGPPPAAEHVDIKPGDAPTKGPSNAPVTVVIFSDFQCPFCSRVEPTLKQLEEDYKGKIKFAWKNEPLPFHNHAQLAAEAALAANEQGKFWEMHDKMFANQQKLERVDLDGYAQELGLNMGKFKAALDGGKFTEKVKKDAAEGAAVGASGTPTFFINGNKLVGAQPVDAFKKLIDAELAKK